LRSGFRFKFLVGTTQDPADARSRRKTEIGKDWERLVREVLLPIFLEGPEGDYVNAWYSGSNILDYEVKEALAGDYSLAGASMVFVFVYLLLHTHSVLLSALGPLLALLAVPVTFVFSAVFWGNTTLSFANFLSLFLIVGFGADVIFVYTDFWEESLNHKDSLEARLAWTYTRALKSSITTTGTTALAFLVAAI